MIPEKIIDAMSRFFNDSYPKSHENQAVWDSFWMPIQKFDDMTAISEFLTNINSIRLKFDNYQNRDGKVTS